MDFLFMQETFSELSHMELQSRRLLVMTFSNPMDDK